MGRVKIIRMMEVTKMENNEQISVNEEIKAEKDGKNRNQPGKEKENTLNYNKAWEDDRL